MTGCDHFCREHARCPLFAADGGVAGTGPRDRRRAARRPGDRPRAHPPAARLGAHCGGGVRSAFAPRRRFARPGSGVGSGEILCADGRYAFEHAARERPPRGHGGGFSACAGAFVPAARALRSPAVCHPFAALLAGGGGGTVPRKPGGGGRSLGRSSAELAPDARNVRGPDRGPVHGTADSGWVAVRVPQGA